MDRTTTEAVKKIRRIQRKNTSNDPANSDPVKRHRSHVLAASLVWSSLLLPAHASDDAIPADFSRIGRVSCVQ